MAIDNAQIGRLIVLAQKARERAYAPYSKFSVGAAVMGESGKVYTGCNVENASYGLTVCAERVAVWKAISEGERQIAAVAIVAGDEIARPCGACLQVMAEFAPKGAPLQIVTAAADGSYEVHTLAGYLPRPFELG